MCCPWLCHDLSPVSDAISTAAPGPHWQRARQLEVSGRPSRVTPGSNSVRGLGSASTFRQHPPIPAIVPILASPTTCALCGIYHESYAFSIILLSILARGLPCLQFSLALGK